MPKAFQTVGTGLWTVRQYAASKGENLSANFSDCCLRRGTFLDRQEKYPKEADSREALTVKSFAHASVSLPFTPISSRPPLRIPPGRCASVECSLFYFLLSNYNFPYPLSPGLGRGTRHSSHFTSTSTMSGPMRRMQFQGIT